MKARLVYYQDSLQLLLCTGKINTVSEASACEFLLHFDNPAYYSGPGKWDYESITMANYGDSTVAFVDDNGTLCIESSEAFRKIMDSKDTNFITVAQYAEKHGKQVAIVRRLCQNGRIEGVIQKGKTWLIPETSPYPPDERYRK